MKTLDDLKEMAKEYAEQAKFHLQEDGFLLSALICISEDKQRCLNMAFKDDADEEFFKGIVDLASKEEANQSIMVLIDSTVADLDYEEMEKAPKDLAEHKDAMDAIVCYVHTRAGSWIYRLPYTKDEKGYTFCDIMGWKEIRHASQVRKGNCYGSFSDNPFRI